MEQEKKSTDRNKLNTALHFVKVNKNTFIRYGLLILVVVVFAAATGGRIFSKFSISSILSQLTPLIILCVGMTFIFAHGNFDISSGAVLALSALVSIFVINGMGCTPLSVFVALLVGIVLCEVFYLFNIFVSIKFRIMSTIGSLAIMFTARGAVTYLVSQTMSGYKLDDTSALALFREQWFMILCVIIVAVICWLVFSFTAFGKYDRAIGDNPLSSMQSGAKVNKVKYISYAIAGACVGLATLFYLSRTNSVTQNFGQGREMDIMIALILGGMLLSGGSKSRMSAAIVGSITYVILTNGLSQLGLSDAYVLIIKSVVFIIMIATTLRRSSTIKAMPR
ncbi:MAG: ABC transporter permease [Clostridiales bacterium]|nr:ABC transporter permease [Clostridiales bacterium]